MTAYTSTAARTTHNAIVAHLAPRTAAALVIRRLLPTREG